MSELFFNTIIELTPEMDRMLAEQLWREEKWLQRWANIKRAKTPRNYSITLNRVRMISENAINRITTLNYA